jgi:hypothetical protein
VYGSGGNGTVPAQFEITHVNLRQAVDLQIVWAAGWLSNQQLVT